MGCHTWFFKPNKLKIEDARISVIEKFNKSIKFNENIINFYNETKINNISEIINDDGDSELEFTTKKFYDLSIKIFGHDGVIGLLVSKSNILPLMIFTLAVLPLRISCICFLLCLYAVMLFLN
jgi:hypothetical protein